MYSNVTYYANKNEGAIIQQQESKLYCPLKVPLTVK